MNNLMGMIKSAFDTSPYGALLNNRPDYMLPFGARYRVIDIVLSNFCAHNISKVLLHGGQNIRSTLDHVGNGRHWEMDKRTDGLVITAPSKDELTSRNRRISSYYNSLTFFEQTSKTDIYIVNPMVLSQVNISEAYEQFKKNNYDVMFLYKKQEDPSGRYLNARKINFDENGEVLNIGLNLGTEEVFNLFMDYIIIKKDVFKKIITDSYEKDNASTLSESALNHKNELKIGTYKVVSHLEYIKDLNSFYNANLNLLNERIYSDLFLLKSGILTKNKDEPSTLYARGSEVSNCVVANGCIIEGQIKDSVIFRGVKVGKNAIVKNSVIFQGTVIEDGAIVVNSVVDKYAIIKEGVFVQGTKNNPYVVKKNQVLEK